MILPLAQRTLLKGHAPAIYAGANDALSARLAEDAGFDGIWVSSLGLSASIGVRDEGLLSLTEVLDRSSVIRKAVRLPLLVDCETGFGEEASLRRLIREASYLSIDGVCIEDAGSPKRNSFSPGTVSLLRSEEFADKIAAMVEEREDLPAVVARTNAFVAGMGVDEVLRRVSLYAEAGADLVIVHTTKPSPEDLEAFLHRWMMPVPIGIIPTSFEKVDLSDISEMFPSLSLVIYANQALRASAAAMNRTLAALAKGVWDNDVEMLSMQQILDIVRW